MQDQSIRQPGSDFILYHKYKTMSGTNGLMCPEAFSNPQTPYYVDADGGAAVIVAPTLVSPIALAAADRTSTGYMTVGGLAAGGYQGAVSIQAGTNAVQAANQVCLTGRSTATGCIVEVGDNAQASNLLLIAGAQGTAQVYDEKYNQPINTTAVASSTGSLPAAGGFGFSYTPDKTGAYMLQVNINIRNADSIPVDGFIEWIMSAAGSEVQYASSMVNSNMLNKVLGMDDINGVPGGLAEPTDYSFSNLCFLTAGVATTFSITTARNSAAGGAQWAIQNYDARLVQCC